MGYFACSCACCCFHFTCGDFSTCSELQNVKNECVPCTMHIISKNISLNVLSSMILFFLLFFISKWKTHNQTIYQQYQNQNICHGTSNKFFLSLLCLQIFKYKDGWRFLVLLCLRCSDRRSTENLQKWFFFIDKCWLIKLSKILILLKIPWHF